MAKISMDSGYRITVSSIEQADGGRLSDREIYVQRVDELDLITVIKAVNQISISNHSGGTPPIPDVATDRLRAMVLNGERYIWLKKNFGAVGYHIDHDNYGFFFVLPSGDWDDQRFGTYDEALDAAMAHELAAKAERA
jgi:hypothetical protein